MIKRFDRLIIGVTVILLTLFAVMLVTQYELTTGNHLGYYGIGFLPLMALGIYLIASSFAKEG